jgi:hypothetical protein
LDKTIAINICGIRVKAFFNSGFFYNLCDRLDFRFFDNRLFNFLAWLIGIFDNA